MPHRHTQTSSGPNLPLATTLEPIIPIEFPTDIQPFHHDSHEDSSSDVDSSDSEVGVDTLEGLKKNNQDWAASMLKQNPYYFKENALGQKPSLLWIGCSDSRVVPSTILQLSPGDIFEHRNIANIFPIGEMNSLSVLDYAVNVLKVKHVVVCGHLGCGGIQTALGKQQYGLIDNWLRNIKEIYGRQYSRLKDLPKQEQLTFLTELNVAKSIFNIAHTTIMQNAWLNGQEITLHGWIYSLYDGLIYDLHLNINSMDQVSPCFQTYELRTEAKRRRSVSVDPVALQDQTFQSTRSKSRPRLGVTQAQPDDPLFTTSHFASPGSRTATHRPTSSKTETTEGWAAEDDGSKVYQAESKRRRRLMRAKILTHPAAGDEFERVSELLSDFNSLNVGTKNVDK
jgi:carbonic anhydrase